MRRLPVAYRPEALQDLTDIFGLVLRLSQALPIAEGYVRRIKASCDRVGDAPRTGRPRDDLFLGLPTVSFERAAVIAYLVQDEQVLITSIFYGGRDYESL